MDTKAGQLGVHYFRSEVVRVEVLMLLSVVLTHPNASTLKNYEILKQYVTHVLTHWVDRIVKHSLNRAQNRWH